jgi:uncharacterized protein
MSQSVPSPCIGLCVLEPATGLCKGCFRSMEEIGAWLSLDEDGRRAVLARVAERRSRKGAARE